MTLPPRTDGEPTLGAGETLCAINENLRLIARRDGLTFGTDAYLLAAFVRPSPRALCVDLGSGTGVLSLLLARKDKVRRAVGVEIQATFASLIARNAALCDLADRVVPLCADVRELTQTTLASALLNSRQGGVCADMVVTNPPYLGVGNGARNAADEKYLARHEVCGGVDDFCAAAERILRPGGTFYAVYRPDRLTALFAAMREHRLEPKRLVFVHADEKSEPSSVLLEARAGGAPSLHVLPPLMLHTADSRGDRCRALCARAQRIYDTMQWQDD